MATDFPATAKDVSESAKLVREAAPDLMKGFGMMGKATYADGALSGKVKELMALAIGVSLRCEGCIAAHTKSAIDYGATREEVAEAVATAVYMGGGPSMLYGGQALRAYDQFKAKG